MIDFYDLTSLSSAIDADLKKRMEISEAFLAELFQPGKGNKGKDKKRFATILVI